MIKLCSAAYYKEGEKPSKFESVYMIDNRYPTDIYQDLYRGSIDQLPSPPFKIDVKFSDVREYNPYPNEMDLR